jgi:hypothetical protein
VDLFDEDRYGDVLRRYDLAHQAGRLIIEERARDDALALEQVLHTMRTSEHAHHKHMAIAVPPYLQELLLSVSEKHYTDALRYDRLIERLLRLPYVFFVTLNYDLLLDKRLNSHHVLSSLDDYITQDKNWSLVKLHGSVNWFHKTSTSFVPQMPPAELRWDAEHFNCVAPNATLEYVRDAHPGRNTDRYPALALPEGPDDRLVLPSDHLRLLHAGLREREIDLLVIGYSGLDRQVLGLVGTTQKVRRMTVINRDGDGAQAVFDRFREAGIEPVCPNIVDGDFASWTDTGGLNQLVDEYDGPYTDDAAT